GGARDRRAGAAPRRGGGAGGAAARRAPRGGRGDRGRRSRGAIRGARDRARHRRRGAGAGARRGGRAGGVAGPPPGGRAGRAVGTLLVRHGVAPAKQPLVLGRGQYANALAEALAAAGCEVARVDGERTRAIGSTGHTWVSGLKVESDGERRRIPCDLIAVAA